MERPVTFEELRSAVRALSERESAAILLDPARYYLRARGAEGGAETGLSPAAVHLLEVLLRYFREHGEEGVRLAILRWKAELRPRASGSDG